MWNAIFSMKKVDLDVSQLNRKITSYTTFHLYFLLEIVLAHFQSLAKYMKEDVWKSFFVNLQVSILQLHYRLTSSQIIFRDFK